MKFKHIIRAIENDINKTHDGTSLGKVRSAISQWAATYCTATMDGRMDDYGGTNTLVPNAVFDKRGRKIAETFQDTEHMEGHYATADLTRAQKHEGDLHFVDAEGRYMPQVDGLPVPAYCFQSIMKKNEEGEYYIRSETIVGEEGGYVTAIRNDNFGPENEGAVKKLLNNMTEDGFNATTTFTAPGGEDGFKWRDKYDKGIQKENDRADNWEMKGKHEKAEQIRKDAHSKVINKIGTWEQAVYEGKGYKEQFEEQNVKIRTTRNENTKGYPIPQNDL